MRIGQPSAITKDIGAQNLTAGRSAKPFADVYVQSRQKLHKDALGELVAKVDEQSESLAHQRTFENLTKFKRSVRAVLDEVVRHGLQLAEESGSFQHDAVQKRRTIKIIDEKMLELQDHLLDNEKDALELLDKIGEIKGMLVNLYY